MEETVGAFAELAAAGTAGVIGGGNLAGWRLEQARQIAAHNGWAPYTCVQQAHTYLVPRARTRQLHIVSDEIADYAATNPDVTVTAYSPLFAGYYARRAQPRELPTDAVSSWRRLEVPGTDYDHASNWRRLEVLDEVVAETGATPNQVVLAWILGGDTPLIPIFSASSIEQLDECLGALDLVLDDDHRKRLDEAC
ncbi:aldo/keto reductase [Alloactinosynnema sp. L-07]|uniref:aldo/keto reductase n=1 Tax=Alloactinosynnema sp. L-07 TaxID=1653480 RepID=UPI0006B58144|nr:aldo/keto reductase [Alloactinosynnema sp. L-07]